MPTVSQVGQASIVLLFAFVGVEVALTPSGEIRDPAKTVPRSILTALAVATSIYLAVQTVAQGTLGPELPLFKDAPLVETAGRLFGTGAKLIFLVGMAVSIFGYIAGDMLGTPRALFALARDGVLPARARAGASALSHAGAGDRACTLRPWRHWRSRARSSASW